MTTPVQAALKRYHAAYNNTTYTAIRTQVANLTDDAHYTQLMNHIIDTALHLVGHPAYADGMAVGHAVSAVLTTCDPVTGMAFVAAIVAHLSHFDATHHTLITLKTYWHLCLLEKMAADTLAEAAQLRGHAGHTAYYSLYAAHRILRGGYLALDGRHTTSYLREKLTHGAATLQLVLERDTLT